MIIKNEIYNKLTPTVTMILVKLVQIVQPPSESIRTILTSVVYYSDIV